MPKTKRSKDYVIGPNGEKRPKSPIGNAVRIFEIATGQTKEEYVDGPKEGRKNK